MAARENIEKRQQELRDQQPDQDTDKADDPVEIDNQRIKPSLLEADQRVQKKEALSKLEVSPKLAKVMVLDNDDDMNMDIDSPNQEPRDDKM